MCAKGLSQKPSGDLDHPLPTAESQPAEIRSQISLRHHRNAQTRQDFVTDLVFGHYDFGEIALIDGGPRSATVTSATDLVCYGLTFWEFRPLIERNGAIGWKLLQALAERLRAADPS